MTDGSLHTGGPLQLLRREEPLRGGLPLSIDRLDPPIAALGSFWLERASPGGATSLGVPCGEELLRPRRTSTCEGLRCFTGCLGVSLTLPLSYLLGVAPVEPYSSRLSFPTGYTATPPLLDPLETIDFVEPTFYLPIGVERALPSPCGRRLTTLTIGVTGKSLFPPCRFD